MSLGPTSPRLQFLQKTQNSDGGWGYFPGKQSWIEPTVYATLALSQNPASAPQVARAWNLIRSWELPQAGWQISPQIAEANWTSALCINLYAARGICDSHLIRTVDWMIQTVGAEGGFLARARAAINPVPNECDYGLQGWPWRPNTSSWVEPTAHAIIALNRAAVTFGNRINLAGVRARIDLAERMLLDRRCQDGGWNYGNRRVLRTWLPSFPDTTALALLGLLANRRAEATTSLARAQDYWRGSTSPLATAWLKICLRNYGLLSRQQSPPAAGGGPSQDILLAAIQSLGEAAEEHCILGLPDSLAGRTSA
ncbi:MAG TPA: hypothetical protein VMZ52_16885 [Bryobacteraceae bacterium]|nr:hypothetical protein [Bryobacteraceae bacterium]